MAPDIRFTLWDGGAYALVSNGTDGTRSVLLVHGDGAMTATGTFADGASTTSVWQVDDDGGIRLVTVGSTGPATGAPLTYDTAAAGALDGPWVPGRTIDKDLADGGHLHVTREGDGTGHYWEGGSRTAGVDADGMYAPGRDWVRSWHPSHDAQHPDHEGRRESTEWGTIRGPGSRTSTYTTGRESTRDDLGRTRSVWEHHENGSDGSTQDGVGVTNFDGTRSHTWNQNEPDGTWRIVTVTTDANGDGTKHVTRGQGDEVTSDTTEDVHEDPHAHPDDDPSPPPDGAPVGDDTAGTEGNPDGPFDRVRLRRLLGGAWHGPDDLDTLGAVDARLRPWLDRLGGFLTGGGSGSDGELLDSLGAPPVVGITLVGSGHDPTEELDGLGAPHPFLDTLLTTTVGDGVAQRSAHTIDQLRQVAEGVAVTAAAVGRSVDLVRPH